MLAWDSQVLLGMLPELNIHTYIYTVFSDQLHNLFFILFLLLLLYLAVMIFLCSHIFSTFFAPSCFGCVQYAIIVYPYRKDLPLFNIRVTVCFFPICFRGETIFISYCNLLEKPVYQADSSVICVFETSVKDVTLSTLLSCPSCPPWPNGY